MVVHSQQSLNSGQDGSEQAGAIKLMNTETYSLNYTDLNAMTRWSDM